MTLTAGPGATSTSPSGEPSFRSVVHVNEKGGRFGGTEEYLAVLTGELAQRGVRSHLVCGWVGDVSEVDWASVDVVESLASRTPQVGTGDAVAAIVEALGADVVYVHNIFDVGVLSALTARSQRPTLLWYVHDHYMTCLTELRLRRDIGPCPARLGAGCLEALGRGQCVMRHDDRVLDDAVLAERQALSAALTDVDAVVVVSPYMRRLLAEAQPGAVDRIHVLDRPVRQIGRGSRRGRSRLEPASVTFAGRITPEKGLDVVIEAAGALPCEAPVRLFVAGVAEDLSYRSHCERLGAEAMAANPRLTVEWCGHLDYAAIDDLLRGSDVVVVPSLWPEPLGATALEAMSAGAAVVVSQVGGLDTRVVDGHGGVLVPPGDVAAWTAALARLIDDPAYADRLARQGRDNVRRHTVGRHVGALDEIVRNVRR